MLESSPSGSPCPDEGRGSWDGGLPRLGGGGGAGPFLSGGGGGGGFADGGGGGGAPEGGRLADGARLAEGARLADRVRIEGEVKVAGAAAACDRLGGEDVFRVGQCTDKSFLLGGVFKANSGLPGGGFRGPIPEAVKLPGGGSNGIPNDTLEFTEEYFFCRSDLVSDDSMPAFPESFTEL